jgi:hypothetical protein
MYLLSVYSGVLQLDSADEQAAQVRRELDRRLQLTEQMSRVIHCARVNACMLCVRC